MKPETQTTTLKLRLGACLTGPTKRMVADLYEAARLYDVARNAMLAHWHHKAERHFAVPQIEHCKGLPKGRKTKSGNMSAPTPARDFTIMVMPEMAETLPVSLAPKEISIELYRAGIAATGGVLNPSSIIASASNAVMSLVMKDTPFPRTGKARRQWQAILWHEAARPVFRRGEELPLVSSQSKISLSDSGHVLSFNLWSKQSGRKNTSISCRIGTRRLPDGYKRALRLIAGGHWKMLGSKLCYHEPKSRRGKGHWALHLTYNRPQEPIPGLRKEFVAHLELLGADDSHPFLVHTAGLFRPWKLGDVNVYINVLRRLEARRAELSGRYADKSGRGHGRGRLIGNKRPLTRKARNAANAFQWRIVSEIVKFCETYGCGTVAFSEPNQWKKDKSWFSPKGRYFDWTGFLTRLKHKLWVNGIELCESEGDGQKAGDRSQPASLVSGVGSDNLADKDCRSEDKMKAVSRKTVRARGEKP